MKKRSLLQRLCNASVASVTGRIGRQITERKKKPGWYKVAGGPLAGAEIFLPDPASGAWLEMAQGNFDSFIYEELANITKIGPGNVVWDIGSHFGYHALSFAAFGAEVLAFEPNAHNTRVLSQNLARNPSLASRIRCRPVAVSDFDGEMTFIQSDDLGGESTGSHLEKALAPLEQEVYASFERATVPTLKMDTIISKEKEKLPDVIKIDVEGAECLVLQGGRQLISQKKPILFIEVHHICAMFGVQQFLWESGYKIKILDEKNSTPSRCFVVATA